jgi:hypothetical protein
MGGFFDGVEALEEPTLPLIGVIGVIGSDAKVPGFGSADWVGDDMAVAMRSQVLLRSIDELRKRLRRVEGVGKGR